jgi:hypothetical protein
MDFSTIEGEIEGRLRSGFYALDIHRISMTTLYMASRSSCPAWIMKFSRWKNRPVLQQHEARLRVS